MGPINAEGSEFIAEIGRRLTRITGDPRETFYLFQRLSVCTQRFNNVAFNGTFSSNTKILTELHPITMENNLGSVENAGQFQSSGQTCFHSRLTNSFSSILHSSSAEALTSVHDDESEHNAERDEPVMSEEPKKSGKNITIEAESLEPFGAEAKSEGDVGYDKDGVDKEEEEEVRARKIEKKVKQEIAKEELVTVFTEAFQLFDIENEGFINPRKLFSALSMLGYHPTEAEIQDLTRSMVKDNKEISLDEFLAMMFQAKDKTLEEEKVRETSCVFDTDENDVINVEDIELINIRMGHNLSRDQLEKVIVAADVNGDGVVTFEDFLSVYNQKLQTTAASKDVKRLWTVPMGDLTPERPAGRVSRSGRKSRTDEVEEVSTHRGHEALLRRHADHVQEGFSRLGLPRLTPGSPTASSRSHHPAGRTLPRLGRVRDEDQLRPERIRETGNRRQVREILRDELPLQRGHTNQFVRTDCRVQSLTAEGGGVCRRLRPKGLEAEHHSSQRPNAPSPRRLPLQRRVLGGGQVPAADPRRLRQRTAPSSATHASDLPEASRRQMSSDPTAVRGGRVDGEQVSASVDDFPERFPATRRRRLVGTLRRRSAPSRRQPRREPAYQLRLPGQRLRHGSLPEVHVDARLSLAHPGGRSSETRRRISRPEPLHDVNN